MFHLTDENDIAIFDIIGAAMDVHSELKSGLLEAVYAEAMTMELDERGVEYEAEVNAPKLPVESGYTFAWDKEVPSKMPAENMTITAERTPLRYSAVFNTNGGIPEEIDPLLDVDCGAPIEKPADPEKEGHTFKGWATSASGSVAYAAGASYTANAAVTLYAVWQANTYTVKYDANGGSGAPGNQTKTYGAALTLSSTKPTRANYTFKGWATSASATTATYAAGGSYTADAGITLYAVWELAYVSPIVHGLIAARCNSSGTEVDDGTCGLIKFDWETTNTVSAITIAWESASAGSGSATVTASGTSGAVSKVIGTNQLSVDASYTITVTVKDSGGESFAKTTLNGAIFPIDAKAGGKGVSFGKPAELGAAESLGGNGVADFAFDAKFNQPVYGKALGMDRLPAIPINSDLNDYMEPGCYAVHSNAIAASCANIPVDRAGRLEVWSATGEGVRLEQWSYLRQRFIPYNSGNAVWERDITRSDNNVWTFGEWVRTSLSKSASEKLYHEQKVLWEGGMYMTETHTINLSEPVSKQANGIVLVFCKYADGAVQDNNFNHFFVPKWFITNHKGYGNAFTMMDINFGQVCHKYLYINDAYISGHANNDLTGTGTSGITFANNKYVLRYVLGV